MAKHETSWVLNLVDNLTKPLRNATKATEGTQSAVKRVTAALDDMSDENRAAAESSLKAHADLTRELAEEQREVKKLTNWLDDLGDTVDPLTKAQIDFKVKDAQTKARRYEEQLVNIDEELKKIADGPDPAKLKANWSEAVVVANQTAELVEKAISGISFTANIEDLRVNIQRMTDASGDKLDGLTQKAYRLGEVFKESPEEIAKAANAMTKQIGGSYEENLKRIEDGFEKGANINGEFLDSLKEYPAFIKQVGATSEEAIAITTWANKNGIFSDKALDSIKEGSNELNQLSDVQMQSLNNIGITQEDLWGKRGLDKITMISKAMKGATDEAKQLVISNIFRGAGEDSGFGLFDFLAEGDFDMANYESVEQAGSSITGWLADLQSSFANTFGGIGSSAVAMAPLITAVSTLIPLITTLSKVTWIQNVASKAAAVGQWVLNAAMNAFPVFLIITAIVALIALVVSAANHFDSWGSSVLAFLGPIGILISAFMMIKRHWDSIVEAFKSDGILGGLKRIGLVLLDVFMHPLQRILGWVAELTGWDWAKDAAGSVEEFRKKMELVTDGEKEGETADPKVAADKDTKPGEFDFASLSGDAPKLDGPDNIAQSAGLGNNSQAASAPKMTEMNLNVNNVFNVKDGADFMARKDEILNYIVGKLNDTMKDALIAAG